MTEERKDRMRELTYQGNIICPGHFMVGHNLNPLPPSLPSGSENPKAAIPNKRFFKDGLTYSINHYYVEDIVYIPFSIVSEVLLN